jgi:hypothetical protein
VRRRGDRLRSLRVTTALQRAAPAFLVLAACLLACASTQRIALDCVPRHVTVYVDREAVEPGTPAVLLRTDRPHQIYLKAPGHEPELVVLEPRTDADGRTTLDPPDVCVDLVRIGVDRKLSVEAEQPDAEPAPASGSHTP